MSATWRRCSSALGLVLALVAPAGAGQNILSWQDNSTNEKSFYIARKLGHCSAPGTWYFRASVGADIRTYTDTGLVTGQVYCYKVRAVNSYGVSAYCPPAEGTAKPSPTCSTVKTTLPDGTVVYTWVCH